MKYQKVELNENSIIIDAFYFTEGKYSNIIFSYSEVKLSEESNQAKLSFKYHLHSKLPLIFNHSKFKKQLGDLLMILIEESLHNKTTIFKGGTNEGVEVEDRANDSSESDW